MFSHFLVFSVIISYFRVCSSGENKTINGSSSIDQIISSNRLSQGIAIGNNLNSINISSNSSDDHKLNSSDMNMNNPVTISTNPRFRMNYTAFKDKDLTLLISITSGPGGSHLRNAARETWLLPCRAVSTCDYRFFIDKIKANITSALEMESIAHKDIVFRGEWCKHMDRHPEKANYGNVFAKPWVYGGGGYPYYQLRGMYRVDWKICFGIWAKQNDKMAHYHVYVEDDSFMCTENLIYQTTLLRYMNTTKKGLPFRTGFTMGDFFDDSSTFMSKEVTQAFADHYPEPGFNCTELADDGNPANKQMLSWGNSWKGDSCRWRGALWDHPGIKMLINEPIVSKSFFKCPEKTLQRQINKTDNPTFSPTFMPTGLPNITRHNIQCPHQGLIFHHGSAGSNVLADNMVEHLCEYVLLIDKIKDPSEMHKIWKLATATTFHDFTMIFTQDALEGWKEMIKKIDTQERTCYESKNITECMLFRRKLKYEERHVPTPDRYPDPGYKAYYGNTFR